MPGETTGMDVVCLITWGSAVTSMSKDRMSKAVVRIFHCLSTVGTMPSRPSFESFHRISELFLFPKSNPILGFASSEMAGSTPFKGLFIEILDLSNANFVIFNPI